MDILLRVKQSYAMLNERNQRIADVFLQETDAVKLPITEIGQKSATSAATVTRFARKFGFDSFEDFRIELAKSEKTNSKIDLIVSKDDSVEGIKRKVEVLLKTAVTDTTAVLSNTQTELAVSALQSAGRIYLIGAGASSGVAYDLAHKFNRAGYSAIHNWDIHITIEMLHYISKKDVLLAFSYSGNTREVRLACKLALRQGAKVFLVTGSQDEELHKITTALLLQPTTEHLFRIASISSSASAAQIATILYLGVLGAEPEEKIIADMQRTTDFIHELEG